MVKKQQWIFLFTQLNYKLARSLYYTTKLTLCALLFAATELCCVDVILQSSCKWARVAGDADHDVMFCSRECTSLTLSAPLDRAPTTAVPVCLSCDLLPCPPVHPAFVKPCAVHHALSADHCSLFSCVVASPSLFAPSPLPIPWTVNHSLKRKSQSLA